MVPPLIVDENHYNRIEQEYMQIPYIRKIARDRWENRMVHKRQRYRSHQLCNANLALKSNYIAGKMSGIYFAQTLISLIFLDLK